MKTIEPGVLLPQPVEAAPQRRMRPIPPAWYEDRSYVRTASFLLFVLYAVVGIWIMFDLGFALGDATARTAGARYVVAGRDPHLSALGFVWPPLPAFMRIPFVWILGPFGVAGAAGPISTAVAAALTFAVLARVVRELDLHPATATAMLAVYALNPVTIFHAGNGMSESWLFLFLALSVYGYVRWTRRRSALALGVLGMALAGAVLTRYESLFIATIFGLGVLLQAPRGRRMLSAAIAVVPAVYAFGLWLATSHILMGDAFHWKKILDVLGRPPVDAPWLPVERTLSSGIGYAADRAARLGPAFLVLAAVVIVVEGRKLIAKRRASAAPGLVLVAVGLVFPGQVAWLMNGNNTYGVPRYFASLTISGVLVAAWLLRDSRATIGGGSRRAVAAVAVIAALAAGCLSTTVALADPKIAGIEGEAFAFSKLPGFRHASETRTFAWNTWKRLTRELDERLRPDDLVLIDAEVAFPMFVFTKHPSNYVVNSDRDYEQLVATRLKRFTYVVLADTSGDAVPHGQLPVLEVYRSPPFGFTWVPAVTGKVATVYALAPAPPPQPAKPSPKKAR